MDRAVAEQPQELNYQREQEQMQHEQEPPASSAAMHDAMHGPLLAATLAFLDLDALASAALCCRDWYRYGGAPLATHRPAVPNPVPLRPYLKFVGLLQPANARYR